MPITIMLIVVLLAAAIYAWIARRRLRLQLPQLWHIMRTHWLATGVLTLYSVICGILLVTMRISPLHMLLFLSGEFTWDTAPVAILLALPVAAGVCGGWWDVARPARERIVNHGILAGLMAMVLPALLGTIGLALATWTDEDVSAGWIWMVVGALLWGGLWVGAILALGMVLGVIGELLAVTVHRLRRQSGPPAPAGVS